jgi:serine/threonine-protein kinase
MKGSTGARAELGPGSVLDGRYRLEALIGRGGFGSVFRATQINIGRPVALKLLHREVLAHAEGIIRFRREAMMAQQLDHPHSVHLLDVGQTEDGQPFIVLELLRGRSLNHVLNEEQTLEPSRVRRIASQILMSLMEAHSLGIVHRDIKPENIFLVDAAGMPDYVKVLDFGLAKAIEGSALGGEQVTAFGETVGTPNYMSPEQVRGRDTTVLTDLYSLGLVISEMLSGEMVFPGTDGLEVARAHISLAPAPLPPAVTSSPLGPVIAKAVAKDPADRFGSAEEMLAALEGLESACVMASAPAKDDIAPTDPDLPALEGVFDDEAPTEQMEAIAFDDEPTVSSPEAEVDASLSVQVDQELMAAQAPTNVPTEPARRLRRWPILSIVATIIAVLVGMALGLWLGFR